MSFTGTYSKTNLSATAYNAFKVTDTSDYTDEPKNTFSGRRVYLILQGGSYIQNNGLDYFDFAFADYPSDEITINALTYDIALNVYVLWIPVTPVTGSSYSAAGVFDFVDYAEYFMFNKVLQLAANPNLWSNKNFSQATSAARAMIDSADTSVIYQDQYEAQVCIDHVGVLENNPNLFY